MITSTAFLLPGFVVSTGALTGNQWTNPSYILLVDNLLAESDPNAGAASDIIIGGFNTNLPQNAVITGIEMELVAKGGAQTVPPLTLTIQALDDTSGTDLFYPYTAPFSGLTPTLTTYSLGTSTYLFSTSFTPDQINNLKFVLTANGDIYVDSFLMKVFYYIPVTPTPPTPTVTGCVSCNSPIEVPEMFLQLPFLSGQTVFYLKPGSMIYANGQPIQPADLSACNIGEIDFTFDEGMKKGNSNNDFQEDASLDITTGFWQVLPSGVVEVSFGSVNDRGLLPYQPYTHDATFMSNHQANTKVIISNSGKFYSRFIRACQAGISFSLPIEVLKNNSVVVNPATKFNFLGAGVNVTQDGTDPFKANITINGNVVSTPVVVGVGTGTTGSSTSTTLTYTLPVSGVNRAAVVQISTQQSVSISSVTIDGVGASNLATSTDAGSNIRQETWGLVAPHVGVVNVVITVSSTAYITSGAECYVGINQSSPFGNTQNATANTNAPTLTLTTANDNSLVVDGLATALTPILYTPGSGQITNWSQTSNLDTRQGSSSIQPAGTAPSAVIMHYSITQVTRWCYTAVELNGVPVVAPVVSPLTVEDQAVGVIVANTVLMKFPTGSVTNPAPGEADITFVTALTNKVMVRATDTTPGYLHDKISVVSTDASVTVTPSVLNPAANEVQQFNLSVTPSGSGMWSKISTSTFSVSVPDTTRTKVIEFSGLTGDTDDEYMLDFELSTTNGVGTSGLIELRLNDDTTTNKYAYNVTPNSTTTTKNTSPVPFPLITGNAGGSTIQPDIVMATIKIKASKTIAGAFRLIDASLVSTVFNDDNCIANIKTTGAWNSASQIVSIQVYVYKSATGSSETCSGKSTLYKINR